MKKIGYVTIIFLLGVTSHAKEIFVSPTGGGSGTQSSPASLDFANRNAAAGDIVQMLPGKYQTQVKPVRSGVSGSPITYRSYESTPAIITHSSSPGIGEGVSIGTSTTIISHIVVDGIDMDGVAFAPNAHIQKFVVIGNNGKFITIKNGHFKYAHGWSGFQIAGTDITIENNTIERCGFLDPTGTDHSADRGDCVGLSGTRILFQKNKVYMGGHNLLAVTGKNVVVQDNYFNNSWSLIYPTGDIGTRVGEFWGTDGIFQRNVLQRTGVADHGGEDLLKVDGTRNIVRHNKFTHATRYGITTTSNGGVHPVAAYNRIYNNSLHKIYGAAWKVEFYAGGTDISNNIFMNNLADETRLNPSISGMDFDIHVKVSEFGGGATGSNKIIGNMFAPLNMKIPLINFNAAGGTVALSVAESNNSQFIYKNLLKKAKFVSFDPSSASFLNLTSDSAGINEGQFLTTASATGNSNSMKVNDSIFFSNGYGIVPGDVIQLQGSQLRAKVVSVDNATKTLNLDTPLNFTSGQGVALSYSGTAPDIGAFEYGGSTQPPAGMSAPKNLAVQ